MSARSAVSSSKPTVVSLFAGGGGSSLGYLWAGFDERLAVDFDPHAAATFRVNFPRVPFIEADISTMTVDAIAKAARVKPGQLDVPDGSPPCQGFSRANSKPKANDPRNQLFREFVRVLRGLKPRAFVMENVSGQAQGKNAPLMRLILDELNASGYVVRCASMNAARYGVPQRRVRLIYIGARNDLGVTPTHPPGNANAVSIIEALRGVVPDAVPPLSDKARAMWPHIPIGGSQASLTGTGWNNTNKPSPMRPFPTLTKVHTGTGYATFVRWDQPRAYSVAELKRLCSFPDDYVLEGTYAERCARLGNAVMPKMMHAVAEHIRATILKGGPRARANR